MKILLIIPPLPERTYPGKTMGPDYLAKVLIDHDYIVDILDLDVFGMAKLEPVLNKYRPDVVGITNLSIQNDIANEIARTVKEFNKAILVVKGGFHELFGHEYTLKYHHEHVDYIVMREGEKTIVELVRAYDYGNLQSRRKYIPGLAYYENNVRHFTGKTVPLSQDELDELLPKRIFYDSSYNFDVFDGRKTAQVLTVRGCMNACNFCMESQTGYRERKRSIDSIYAELFELKEEEYEAVYFDDSTFTRYKKRVKQICELFKKYFPGMVWGCNTRDDCLDEELITTMQDSGCVYMFTGFESAVPEVLAGMNKTYNPTSYLSNAKTIYGLMRNSSIKSSVFLVFGAAKKMMNNKLVRYEPESFEDVKYTINFTLQELKPRYLSMNVLRLLPGAPFSKDEKYGCIRPDGAVIHAGYYDKKWYQANGVDETRTRHHVYRAFEGRGAVVPPQMTPEYCYKILKYAVDAVNESNGLNSYKCKIVMDQEFEDAYVRRINGKYQIAPFKAIETDFT